MVVQGITPERLDSVRQYPQIASCMSIGNYTQAAPHLSTGHLGGNKFTVIIKDCSQVDGSPVTSQVLDDIISGIKRDGFINYFGPQRFGCCHAGTVMGSDIGLSLLKGNLEEAMNLLMKPVYDQDDDSQAEVAKRSVRIWLTFQLCSISKAFVFI
jgi:TruD family tRNA pseudouridine synthase